jgi:hypothetical protein
LRQCTLIKTSDLLAEQMYIYLTACDPDVFCKSIYSMGVEL